MVARDPAERRRRGRGGDQRRPRRRRERGPWRRERGRARRDARRGGGGGASAAGRGGGVVGSSGRGGGIAGQADAAARGQPARRGAAAVRPSRAATPPLPRGSTRPSPAPTGQPFAKDHRAGSRAQRRLGQRRHDADRLLDRRARRADASTPMRTFTRPTTSTRPTATTSRCRCPTGGNVEGETGYACTGDGDCHLHRRTTRRANKLYEMWRANIRRQHVLRRLPRGLGHDATSTADTLRGEQCTSADAARLPDRAAAVHGRRGRGRRRSTTRSASSCRTTASRRAYVAPGHARHAATTGGANAPPYGVAPAPARRLPDRLAAERGRASVVARAMQKYGMYHADGGNIALTARSDRLTTAKWAGLLGRAICGAQAERLRGHRQRGADRPHERLRAHDVLRCTALASRYATPATVTSDFTGDWEMKTGVVVDLWWSSAVSPRASAACLRRT